MTEKINNEYSIKIHVYSEAPEYKDGFVVSDESILNRLKQLLKHWQPRIGEHILFKGELFEVTKVIYDTGKKHLRYSLKHH